jgi:hypothetical protein
MANAWVFGLVGSGIVVGALAARVPEAHACGGCFAPPDEVTQVDSHRMVIALGIEETVLWDQIVYSGDSSDFAWVLPVPSPQVEVEIAENEFFDLLDKGTAPRITPASLPPCAQANAASCGSSVSADSGGVVPEDGVTVYDRDVIGPYEMVTIGSEDSQALFRWLGNNGYAVPDTAVPTLEFYVERGSAFVALRLRPNFGVQAMQPVRVRYPGYMASFPLEMVVVGAVGVVDLALWVIADQRFEAQNYGTVRVDEAELAWDWALNRSNYADVFDATVERGGNRAWVVEHASTLSALPGGDASFEDLELARATVMHPYVTRLRTKLLVDHIDQDLQLARSADATDVSSELVASIDVNYEEFQCSTNAVGGTGTCNTIAPSTRAAAGLLLLLALVALALRRPHRRGR